MRSRTLAAVLLIMTLPAGAADLVTNARQLTFEGRRSGEGYFSADGRSLVFQSERSAANPFYQIYRMSLVTGDVERLSPGHGKTTCAWLHPDGKTVLFASTHLDPEARAKQVAELDFRASGKSRRYAWDYDEAFELFAASASEYTQLTDARGYDAEGSYSPDGAWVAFASNRHAFVEELSDERAAAFARDPSLEIDLYRMRADGSELQRLTHTPGYDGGPFFSPDGSRIVWRRFAEDGVIAEIYTMAVDGSDVRQLTRLGTMSWAPFFHPSGEYVIFATNREGFENFELYLVDNEGRAEPIRVTDRAGFDGLPAFSPDGRTLAWTRRPPAGSSQLYLADWNHDAARARLAQAPLPGTAPVSPNLAGVGPIRAEELRGHVEALSADAMGGRETGSAGGRAAGEYVAGVFAKIGLEPAGDEGSFFQAFEFTAGVSLGPTNTLRVDSGGEGTDFSVDEDWRPLAFSKLGESGAARVVFAGYGIVAPQSSDWPAYDAYADLDVRGAWVLVLRFLPEDVSAEQRQHLNRYAGLRYKAMLARERGALGLVVVTGPHSEVKNRLVPLRFDVAQAGTSMYAVSVDGAVAAALLAAPGRSLGDLQAQLDTGSEVVAFEIEGATLAAEIDLVQEQRTGRNVIARLPGSQPSSEAVLIGAHLDHLGRGAGASLARGADTGKIHPGADDNASGVGALLEIAAWLSGQELARDVLFAAWSGEELGLLGSHHYASQLREANPHRTDDARDLAAYLNMDMVGRFEDEVVFHGVGSSSIWKSELERENVPVGLPLAPQQESYLPTDATSFYLVGVPILSAFTGAHEDYHTPGDTAEKLDYDATVKIARLVGGIARSLATSETVPDYLELARPSPGSSRGGLRVFLGTVPNYSRTDVTGVALSGVVAGGPAEKAGVRAGDVIVRLAGKSIENIYDYTFALEGLKVGDPVALEVVRGSQRQTLQITPESRE